MDHSKRIQDLKDKLAKLAQVERDFPLGREALNIDGLREGLERELAELETSSKPTAQNR
jgi:hypothetical protein